LVAFGALGLVIKLMFFASPVWQRLWQRVAEPLAAMPRQIPPMAGPASYGERKMGRVERISDAVAQTMRRDERMSEPRRGQAFANQAAGSTQERRESEQPRSHEVLGSSFRRSYRRHSAAASKRDDRP
jgi:hypothetical protein